MKRISLEDTTLTVKELAFLAQKETVILTQRGKPVVGLNNLNGHDWESVSLSKNPQFVQLIEASRKAHRERGGISLETLRKELELEPKVRKGKRKKGE